MKKIIFLLPFLMLVSLFSMGQNIKHISLDFNKDNFKIQQDKAGNVYVLSNGLEYFLKSDTLQPALPYIGYNVLVNSTDKYDSHDCSDSKILFQRNVTMAQNPEEIPTNVQPSKNEVPKAVSYSKGVYPNESVEYVGMNECYGYRILTFHVCPFEYDAISKTLYFKTHIDLDIHLNHTPSVTQTRIGNSIYARDIIRQMVVNPEDLGEQDLPVNNRSNNNLTRQTGFEYVIVTCNQFKSVFQQLANWKSRKGIRSKVLTVEEISNYNGSTTMEKIKGALNDIDSLSYVLLGGDSFKVPTCICFIGIDSDAHDTTPADVYYSCPETMNWDSSGNGYYGEIKDSVNLLPILNVSRAPVSTVEDAQVFVNRIINYESVPDTINWVDNILMCGSSLGTVGINNLTPHYINEQSDTQVWSQMIYNNYIAPSWNGNCVRFYDSYTDISHDGTYDFNSLNLQEQLAQGYTFVDVITHGLEYQWQMENNGFYDWQKANELENSGYSIITTTACLTNAFDYYRSRIPPLYCLSQHFINNPQSGILAYLGTSRENWYSNNYTSLGTGATFDALTYSKLFIDRYHRIGKALTAVKAEKMSDAMPSNNTYTSNRKVWMGLNLMGDPEMPVYLSKPKSFKNVSIQFVNDSIYVNAGTGGFDICFINQNDSTEYYIARDIADSVAVFSRIDGVFDVCITKPDYIPYTTTCANTYLQNLTLSGTKTYETGHALIGSDITDKIIQGPVVINSGSTTVKASQGTTITKDFEVNLGAEFNIITND